MRFIRLLAYAAIAICSTVAARAQGGAAAYATWSSTILEGNSTAQHWYMSGKVTSVDGAVATVLAGVAGQMSGYNVEVQGVYAISSPVGETVVMPVGTASRYSGVNNVSGSTTGAYTDALWTTVLAPQANAVRITLTPSDATNGRSLTLLLPATVSMSPIMSAVAQTIIVQRCPKGCQLVSGVCEGCPNGGKLGPKCCKGVSSFLDCVHCTLSCPDGECAIIADTIKVQ